MATKRNTSPFIPKLEGSSDGHDTSDTGSFDFADKRRPTTLPGLASVRASAGDFFAETSQKPRDSGAFQAPRLDAHSNPEIHILREEPTLVGGAPIVGDDSESNALATRHDLEANLGDDLQSSNEPEPNPWNEKFEQAFLSGTSGQNENKSKVLKEENYYFIPNSVRSLLPIGFYERFVDFNQRITSRLQPKHITEKHRKELIASYIYRSLLESYKETSDSEKVLLILDRCFNTDLVNQYPLEIIDRAIRLMPDKISNRPRSISTQNVAVVKPTWVKRLGLPIAAGVLSALAIFGIVNQNNQSENDSDIQPENIAALVADEVADVLSGEDVVPSSTELTQADTSTDIDEDLEIIPSPTVEIEPEVEDSAEESIQDEVPAIQTEATQESAEPTSELANLLQSLNINPEEIRSLPDNLDISTVDQVPGLTPLYTSQTVQNEAGNPVTVYSPNTDLSGLQVEARTVQDRLIVRNTQLNDTRQRLRIGQTTSLTGQVSYASIDSIILPYAETTNGDWVALTYLNPVTSLTDATQPNPESLETRYASLVGQDVIYTSKAGTQRVYTVTKAENGQLTLDNNGFSFNVNYSTLENNNSIRVATPEEIQTRKPTAVDNVSNQVATSIYNIVLELETA